MARVKATNTVPEMTVRRLVYGLGLRYRLHGKALPGRPDLVLRRLKLVIFVHGCFWHRHNCFNGRRMPKSRLEFWKTKLEGNAARDKRNIRKLKALGWRVLVVWECETRDLPRLTRRVVSSVKELDHERESSKRSGKRLRRRSME